MKVKKNCNRNILCGFKNSVVYFTNPLVVIGTDHDCIGSCMQLPCDHDHDSPSPLPSLHKLCKLTRNINKCFVR